jgi:hypothetical protein
LFFTAEVAERKQRSQWLISQYFVFFAVGEKIKVVGNKFKCCVARSGNDPESLIVEHKAAEKTTVAFHQGVDIRRLF